jgi:hypothetical protein
MSMSNMGDMGDIGSLGPGGSAVQSGPVLPDRVDLPFTTEEPVIWHRETGSWVPVLDGQSVGDLPLISGAAWHARDWSARWSAWPVLAEFAATDWRDTIKLSPWDRSEEAQQAEIAALVRAAQDERPDALGEIVAQNATYEDIAAYFYALLRVAPGSRRTLDRLLHIAGLAGILAVMHFKAKPGTDPDTGKDLAPRPRPSQLCPALLPPIEVPGHPSFPSGHATQAMLMALCVEAWLPEPRRGAWQPLLHTLARRVGRNREIAGLHYASDSRAGFDLAVQVFDRLKKEGTQFDTVLAKAGEDWA